MLSRALILAALPLLAVATHGLYKTRTDQSSCSTGTALCCKEVYPDADDPPASPMLSALAEILVQDINPAIGVTCTPITGVGVGGSAGCSAKTVCCENNSFGGVIAVGCLPVEL
ncbi:fungal hydrophobin-domain-containing protein [Daedaleopsis nitida]|nr:fungal hydrophobin-domain-containing protein [Daedaleopsis nitida]